MTQVINRSQLPVLLEIAGTAGQPEEYEWAAYTPCTFDYDHDVFGNPVMSLGQDAYRTVMLGISSYRQSEGRNVNRNALGPKPETTCQKLPDALKYAQTGQKPGRNEAFPVKLESSKLAQQTSALGIMARRGAEKLLELTGSSSQAFNSRVNQILISSLLAADEIQHALPYIAGIKDPSSWPMVLVGSRSETSDEPPKTFRHVFFSSYFPSDRLPEIPEHLKIPAESPSKINLLKIK